MMMVMMIMVKMIIHGGFRVYCLFSTLVKYVFNKSREETIMENTQHDTTLVKMQL
jgi:hypothetical protein